MNQQTKAPEVQKDYSSERDQGGEQTDGYLFDVESAYAYFEQVKDKREGAKIAVSVGSRADDVCAGEDEWPDTHRWR